LDEKHRNQPIPLSYNIQSNPGLRAHDSVAAIIPAYDEADRICRVLKVLQQVECLSEIIVVDDGSNDATGEVGRREAEVDPRIRVLNHPTNLGKGQAIFTGWGATRAANLLMLDADLMGLHPQHVLDLIQPVLEGQADMTIGQFWGGDWKTDLSQRFAPWLSGQRCLRAELLQTLPLKAAAGYGIETALTVAAQIHGWRCRRVLLHGAWHIPGELRRGLWLGIRTKARMYAQIVSAWYLAGGLHRFRGRFRLRPRAG
jgi:glycosyltransferase involved in cell wall biosynthesis